MERDRRQITLRGDDIVVLTDARWSDPKRVRHKMPRAWAEAGNRVLWVETCVANRPSRKLDKLRAMVRAPLCEVAPRLHVGEAPPLLARHDVGGRVEQQARRFAVAACIHRWLLRLRMRPSLLVLWQEAALWTLAPLVPHRRRVYYASDRYRFNQADPAGDRLLAECCRGVDVVFATSEKNRARLARYQPESHVMPHAVDVEWYRAHAHRIPPALEALPRPRVVFTGVATPKVDFRLLVEVARGAPELQLVLAGPVHEDAADAAKRAAAEVSNLVLLGEQSVDDLPSFMSRADVLMLPYVRDVTREYSGLPLKMFEYLVAAKPIVSTPFTDLELDEPDLVDVESTAAGWIRAIRRRLSSPLTEPERERRVQIAEANTYADRIEAQRRILARLDQADWDDRDDRAPFDRR